MKTQIQMDKYGRVLIPKNLRESLGLKPGDRMEFELADDVLILRPTRTDAPILRAIEDSREERMKSILGLETRFRPPL